jgi:hypothetical protein
MEKELPRCGIIVENIHLDSLRIDEGGQDAEQWRDDPDFLVREGFGS